MFFLSIYLKVQKTVPISYFTFILFSRAQKATRQLDMSKDFTEPIESWFWPKVFQENTDENETDLEEPKIKDVTNEEQIQGVQFYPQHFCRRSRADLVISISVFVVVVVVVVIELVPLLSEMSAFRTVRLSVEFFLLGTIPFRALCPLGLSAFGALCTSGFFAKLGSLPLGDLCSSGTFTLWVI